MSSTREYDQYFQTVNTFEDQKRRAAKSSNKNGSPTRLKSKISAAVKDPSDSTDKHIFVAEAVGSVRRVNVSTHENEVVLSGPTAPLTSLVVCGPPSTGRPAEVFAGCWDKNIYAQRVGQGSTGQRVFRGGHTDFVKCLAIVQVTEDLPILLSGSNDKNVCVWSATAGTRLLTLRNHHKTSLSALAVDPLSEAGKISFFSASSDGELKYTVLELSGVDDGSPASASLVSQNTLPTVHPTTIYSLSFYGDEYDLVTGSADGSAAILSRHHNWDVETRFDHGSHVRAVAAGVDGATIITGGRDEKVKVWDASSGGLVRTFEGHFDEVTGLVALGTVMEPEIVSVSLDGTVRSWNSRATLGKMQKHESMDEDEHVEPEAQPAMMTDDEARELAELMEDD